MDIAEGEKRSKNFVVFGLEEDEEDVGFKRVFVSPDRTVGQRVEQRQLNRGWNSDS